MMTELEKQFFECFGIKSLGEMNISQMTISVDDKVVIEGKDLPNNKYNIYPPITAEKLLELICILNELTGRLIELNSSNINDLKEEILKVCISNFTAFRLPYKKKFIEQVRKLFEGE